MCLSQQDFWKERGRVCFQKDHRLSHLIDPHSIVDANDHYIGCLVDAPARNMLRSSSFPGYLQGLHQST